VVRGWLGVSVQPLTPALATSLHAPDTSGALVASVAPDSPAMKAGVKPGDVILAYNGRPVEQARALGTAVAETPVGRPVPITVLRDGARLQLDATIAQLAETHTGTAAVTPEKASLGIAVERLTPAVAQQLGVEDTSGLVVRSVEQASRAAQAGIRPGDVIVQVDHRPVRTADGLTRSLTDHGAGTPILMLVHRNGQSLFVSVS
jgi:serine protease Do